MSQFTRCPACHTVFRVVQDQLRMSDGWVRCGQCADVFDAKASLAASAAELIPVELAQTVPAEPQVPAPLPAFLAAADNPPPESEAQGAAGPSPLIHSEATGVAPGVGKSGVEDSGSGPIEPVLWPDPFPPAGEAKANIAVDAVAPAASTSAADFASNESVETNAPAWRDPALDLALPPAPAVPPVAANGDPPAPAADVSFMRSPPSANPPQSGLRRFVLSLVALALFAVLAVQVAMLERDRLAAMFPQFKPALMLMCEKLGCTVASLRQIESVVIDSSSFNRSKGDTYRLNIGLRNTASVDVALPSVELTLTDSQDQALVRRVLSAAELVKPGSTESVLAAGAEWQGQATITVRLAANAERFTGYRVLAFYP